MSLSTQVRLVLSNLSLAEQGASDWVLVEPRCWEKDLVHMWSVPNKVPRKAVWSRWLAADHLPLLHKPRGGWPGRGRHALADLLRTAEVNKGGIGSGRGGEVGMSNSCRGATLPAPSRAKTESACGSRQV